MQVFSTVMLCIKVLRDGIEHNVWVGVAKSIFWCANASAGMPIEVTIRKVGWAYEA